MIIYKSRSSLKRLFHALLFLILLEGQPNNEDVAKRHMRKEKGKFQMERSECGWRPEQQNIILK